MPSNVNRCQLKRPVVECMAGARSTLPVVAGQLVRLTSSASQHPAMWELLAHEKQLRSRATGATGCESRIAFKCTTVAMHRRPVVG